MDKNLNEIMMTRWDYLSENELKIYSAVVFLLVVCMGIVLSIFFNFLFKIDFLWSILGFIIFGVLSTVIIYKRDFLDEKFELFSSEFEGITYQGFILFLFPASFILSWLFFFISLSYGIYDALAFSLAVYFPCIFIFLRREAYRNENSRLLFVDGHCEQVFGYHPFFYYMLGVTLSRGPLALSLNHLLVDIFVKGSILNNDLILFVLSLLLGCFILSPDIANKIMPFELKRVKGLMKFIILSLVLMMVLLAFM